MNFYKPYYEISKEFLDEILSQAITKRDNYEFPNEAWIEANACIDTIEHIVQNSSFVDNDMKHFAQEVYEFHQEYKGFNAKYYSDMFTDFCQNLSESERNSIYALMRILHNIGVRKFKKQYLQI